MDENELRELWRQATPGSMAIGYQDRPDPPYPHGVNTCVTGNGPNARNNALFYAHCHDAVPLLLDHVERLARLAAALRPLLDFFARAPDGTAPHSRDRAWEELDDASQEAWSAAARVVRAILQEVVS